MPPLFYTGSPLQSWEWKIYVCAMIRSRPAPFYICYLKIIETEKLDLKNNYPKQQSSMTVIFFKALLFFAIATKNSWKGKYATTSQLQK